MSRQFRSSRPFGALRGEAAEFIRTTLRLLLPFVVGALAGCGGPGKQTQPVTGAGSAGAGSAGAGTAADATDDEDAAGAAVTRRMRVGHYSNSDGTMAFHLDRSDDNVARLRYDGSSKEIVLKAEPGHMGRINYVKPDGGVLLHVHRDGRVVAFHKDRRGGIDVRRDDLKPRRAAAEKPAAVKKNQPPDVKLRLGHYSSSDGAMAFVLDRLDEKVVKVRYDGTTEVIKLTPEPGYMRRIDCVKPGGGVLLHIWPDGRVEIFHKDRRGGIPVRRDGDADPL